MDIPEDDIDSSTATVTLPSQSSAASSPKNAGVEVDVAPQNVPTVPPISYTPSPSPPPALSLPFPPPLPVHTPPSTSPPFSPSLLEPSSIPLPPSPPSPIIILTPPFLPSPQSPVRLPTFFNPLDYPSVHFSGGSPPSPLPEGILLSPVPPPGGPVQIPSPGYSPRISVGSERTADGLRQKDGVKAKPCQCDPEIGRNLVVCIDGTANQFGLQNSHVVELYSRLTKNEKQLTYYNSGIGTFVKDTNWIGWLIQFLFHLWDMAVAWNLKKITLSAYQWLSENYQHGDRIFLFGFSRGAYQVRILAGMISTVGLLHKGNNEQIPFAYELYIANTSNHVRESGPDVEPEAELDTSKRERITDRKNPKYTNELCAQFKRTLCHENVAVHFVGAWDTVSSVGVTRAPSLPETTAGMKHVCAFRHALALDELRVKFLPEYANGGAGIDEDKRGDVKEVWFAGSHSDIGGGNNPNLELEEFGPPLRWMLYEAIERGLQVKPFQGGWGPVIITPSMTWFWQILELLPIKRLTYKGPESNSTQRWPPHHGSGRRVQRGQLIHASVFDHMKVQLKKKTPYRPEAQVHDEHLWESMDVSGRDFVSIGREEDAHATVVDEVLSHLKTKVAQGQGEIPDDAVKEGETLASLLQSSAARQAIFEKSKAADVLFDSLERTSSLLSPEDTARPTHDKHLRVTVALVSALATFKSLPYDRSRRANSILRPLLASASSEADRNQIMSIFGNGPLYEPLSGHERRVTSVCFSADGQYIISGSVDETVRIWDAESRQPVVEPLRSNSGDIHCVAFSPAGRLIASGSEDSTIRLWDMALGTEAKPPLPTGSGHVLSVAFSSEGRLLAAGSAQGGTIHIWDLETEEVKEVMRHDSYVRSVAFSPNNKYIASGCDDGVARIWDVETQKLVKELRGHADYVRSVAFSPDGTRVISGSDDGSIRVWSVETGGLVLEPLEGHTDYVQSVAYSSNGKLIVSGSDDCTVRLWDTRTGEEVSKLQGHYRPVLSVAFSPDCKRVVSGASDSTLLIWEVEFA